MTVYSVHSNLSLVFVRLSLVSSGYCCVTFPGYCWLSLVFSGYPWFSVVILGFQWLYLVFSGYCWLSNGYRWFASG